MSLFHHIEIISIPVSDQEASLQFYRDVLGFQVNNDNTFPAGDQQMRWLELSLPNGQAKITLTNWFPEMPRITGLVIYTDKIEEAYNKLQSNGYNTTEIESAPWGHYFTFQDPDGNGWVAQQM